MEERNPAKQVDGLTTIPSIRNNVKVRLIR